MLEDLLVAANGTAGARSCGSGGLARVGGGGGRRGRRHRGHPLSSPPYAGVPSMVELLATLFLFERSEPKVLRDQRFQQSN